MNSFVKQPIETYTIGSNFDGKLPTGATIASGTVAAFDPTGADVSGSVLSGTTLTIVGNEGRIRVLGGTHGIDYKIRFRLTLSNADVLEEDVLMSVENL